MSGWDEGAVYYSDQAPFNGAEHQQAVSRHSVLLKFKEFIRGFQIDNNIYPYRESLIHNPHLLVVNLEHLHAFEPDLPSLLFCFSLFDFTPSVCLSSCFQFETTVAEVLSNLKSKAETAVAGETGEMEESITEDVQILLTSNWNFG